MLAINIMFGRALRRVAWGLVAVASAMGTFATMPVTAEAAIAFRAASPASTAGAAVVSRVAGSTNTANATSLAINRPAGVVANHLLVAQITLKGIVAAVTPPSSWNLIDLRSTSTGGAEITQAVYWRVAGGAEPASYTWSWTGARRVAGGITAYAGVEPTSPIDASGARANNNSATITLPNITTASIDTMLVALLGSSRSSSHSAPTGMTERYDANSGGGAAGVTISESDQTQATAGTTGAKTSTIAAGAADNIAHLIALRARSSLTIPVPAGTVANDVMVASVTFRPCSNSNGGACSATVTAPAGWTLVNSFDQTTGAGTGGYGNRLYIYRRVGSALEPASYTWFINGTPELNGAAGGIASFSGVDTTNPIVTSAGQPTAAASSQTASSINTGTITNTMLVSTYAMNSAGTWTPPAGTTEAVDVASLTVPDTLGISLEMNYEARAAAGATGARVATIANPPTPDTGATHMLALRPASSIDHYRVQNNTSGVNCQAENITITAHDSSHTAVTLTNTTTITVTATFVSGSGGPGNRGDWTLLTGAGILSNGTADDGVATYTFAASGESGIVLALKDTWAQTVNIAVTDGTVTDTSGTASADASYNQNLLFNASGFRISNGAGAAGTIPTQIAGTTSATLYLQAIRTDTNTGACTSAFASGTTVSVEAGFTCNNPTSCAGRQVTLTTTAASGNSAATAPNNNGASPLAYTALNFLFSTANAEAPFTLSYPDVGQLTLNFRHTIPLGTGSPSANTMLGSSNAFVVKPAGFTITSIQRTADSFANPGAFNGTGPIFIKAGDDFTATLTAVTSSGAATPNFGKETSPEGVKLSPVLVPLLGLTTNPAIANDTVAGGAFTNGVATVTNLSWGEVGIITITPSVGDADYLGVGDVSGTTSGNVGRFIPYDFGVSLNAPAFAPACSTATAFTYIGQSFVYATAPVITVTARNKTGATTRNYTGGWWKITNTSLTARSYTAATGTLNTAGLPLSASDPSIADLGGVSSGQGTLTFSAGTGLLFTRAAPVAPFNADISLAINVIDDDGVAYASNPARFGNATAGNGISFTGGGNTMRWGRLKLSNALGSEFADLALPIEAQYFNGTSFVTNADDGCTAFLSSAVMFTNFQRNLAACETYLSSPPASITLSSGKSALILRKPGSGNNGSVDLKPRLSATDTGTTCVNTASGPATNANLDYLQSNWGGGGTYDKNPTGRAVFGVPLVPKEFIYFRENY